MAPAITSRFAFSRAARLPANVSALTLNNCPFFDALDAGDHRHVAGLAERLDDAGVDAASDRLPTMPRSTVSPLVALCGAAFFTGATPASAPVRPDRLAAGRVDRRDEPRVDRAGQHRRRRC